jgi:hypothetical protein
MTATRPGKDEPVAPNRSCRNAAKAVWGFSQARVPSLSNAATRSAIGKAFGPWVTSHKNPISDRFTGPSAQEWV